MPVQAALISALVAVATLAGCTPQAIPPQAIPPRAVPPRAAARTSTPHLASPSSIASPTPPGRPPATGAAGASGCPRAADLSLRAQLAQTLMIWVDGGSTRLPAALRPGALPLGAVFVGGTGTAGLRAGVFRRLSARTVPPLVAVDEEGGRVHHLRPLLGAWPAARTQAGTMSTAAVRALARTRGHQLRELGITLDLAPVVDVSAQPARAVIGDRSFSADPAEVSAYATAFAQGLRDAGLLVTLKHFPGHGRATGDTHNGSVVTPPLADLRRRDLLPYQALLARLGPDVPVMVGHMSVPGLTGSGRPASLDPAAYRLLDSVGHRGLVLTDELTGMKAISTRYPVAEAARHALAAGADLVLLAKPGSVDALLDQLEQAVSSGRLSRARVAAAAQAVLDTKTCQ